MLCEKRYSLLFEGQQRLMDLREYRRLSSRFWPEAARIRTKRRCRFLRASAMRVVVPQNKACTRKRLRERKMGTDRDYQSRFFFSSRA